MPGAGLYLKEAPFKKYLKLYEARLSESATGAGRSSLSWRNLLRQQVERLAQSIMEGSAYTPFVAQETGKKIK